jgi:hypothetical protein
MEEVLTHLGGWPTLSYPGGHPETKPGAVARSHPPLKACPDTNRSETQGPLRLRAGQAFGSVERFAENANRSTPLRVTSLGLSPHSVTSVTDIFPRLRQS